MTKSRAMAREYYIKWRSKEPKGTNEHDSKADETKQEGNRQTDSSDRSRTQLF